MNAGARAQALVWAHAIWSSIAVQFCSFLKFLLRIECFVRITHVQKDVHSTAEMWECQRIRFFHRRGVYKTVKYIHDGYVFILWISITPFAFAISRDVWLVRAMNLDMGSKSKWFFVFLKERSEDLRLHARNIIFPRSLIAIRKHLRALEFGISSQSCYLLFFFQKRRECFQFALLLSFVWSNWNSCFCLECVNGANGTSQKY